MTDLLLRFGASNLIITFAIALVALAVQHTGKHPRVAHLLWLVLLVKLVTPPLLTVPVVPIPGPTPAAEMSMVNSGAPAGVADLPAVLFESPSITAASSPTVSGWSGLAAIWLLGSACILVWSLVRVFRFHRLLGAATEPAPAEMQSAASKLAGRLGLGTTPTVYTTSAHLSPMVWWIGGRVRVLIPAALSGQMDPGEFRLVLAHELAHVSRRDHMVRWLEWLACVLFWWNPVAWLARRNLRVNEEICCDALVLESLGPDPRTYGNSLLKAVEFLASPALRPPAMASEINSGGFLERRFRMIASEKPIRTTPRWVYALLLLFVAAVVPLGAAQAEEPDFEAVGTRLMEAVKAGELSPEQAAAMMGELARARFAERLRAEGRRRSPFRAEMAAVKERIWAAVKEGKLTEEEAKAKWEAYLKSLKARATEARGGRPVPSREEMGKVKEEIWAAVKEGQITEQQAENRWRSYLSSLRARRIGR